MSTEGDTTREGMLFFQNGVMYIITFCSSSKANESPETLINRLLLKEEISE